MVKLKEVTADLTGYRNAVLKLPKKDFRALQAGKKVKIPQSIADRFPDLFKGVKNGD